MSVCVCAGLGWMPGLLTGVQPSVCMSVCEVPYVNAWPHIVVHGGVCVPACQRECHAPMGFSPTTHTKVRPPMGVRARVKWLRASTLKMPGLPREVFNGRVRVVLSVRTGLSVSEVYRDANGCQSDVGGWR